MRRRFGRGRRRGSAGGEKAAPLDAAVWMTRIGESGLVGEETLTPLELAGVAPERAVLGEGDGGGLLVGYSPYGGGTALFAVLALACSRDDFTGRAVALAPDWSEADRRRLARLRPGAFTLRAVLAPRLGDGSGEVQPARLPDPPMLAPERVGAALAGEDRALFDRALAGLRGLAAKHGGSLRGVGDRVELLLLAQAVASLRSTRSGPRLELGGPDRGSLELRGEALATALDRLEGSLRKLLNDRRERASEAGLRASLLPLLERAAGARAGVAWPLTGDGAGSIDWVGVDEQGRLTVAAARERLDLQALGEALDAALDPRVQAPLFASAAPPVTADAPRLLLAARDQDDLALGLLPLLAVEAEVYTVSEPRGGPLRLERRELPERPAPAREPRRVVEAPEVVRDEPAPAPARTGGPRVEPVAERPDAVAEARSGFDEVSLFDLEDETSGETGPPTRRRRHRGGRRRGRRGQGSGEKAEASSAETGDLEEEPDREPGDSRRGGRRRERTPGARATAAEAEDEDIVDDEDLAALAEDVPEPEESVDLAYEDEDAGEEDETEADAARHERELRRRARLAKTQPEPEPPARPPRRRAAFVAHADRVSVLTAIVLARDVRLVESFWVYPQAELMTFFRSVATDLREETPIFLVGFAASPPARDTIQAASLYRGRLHWFDHHEWPPEDVVALGQAIGEEAVHIEAGAENSLARVIAERTRRSRFSDKLVELVTGRFSQHDYERWGRLWWHRAGEIATRPGDRRADIEPLLAGRPSDLAKESARVPVPPPPAELEFVSSRDFRLVHFGGYVMVVLDVPEGMDLHLSARIARERYDAQLSLAGHEGGELLVIGADESGSRRELDLGAMAAHLAAKHEWISALADEDHVARLSVHDLRTVPGRLDEVISEIAMGRSIVEG